MNRESANAAARRYYHRNREKCIAATIAHRNKNRDRLNAYNRKRWHALSDEEKALRSIARRWAARLRKYGITAAEYEKLWVEQGGVCAVCMDPEREGANGELDVDHDHVTGKVRGLVCRSCNHALGVLGDSVEGLERALRYLKGEL